MNFELEFKPQINKDLDLVANPTRFSIYSISRDDYIKCGKCSHIDEYFSEDNISSHGALFRSRIYRAEPSYVCKNCGHVMQKSSTRKEKVTGCSIFDNGDSIKFSWLVTDQGITVKYEYGDEPCDPEEDFEDLDNLRTSRFASVWLSPQQRSSNQITAKKLSVYGSTRRHTLVINTKTKQSYLLPVIDLDTRKRYGGILNVSYRSNDLLCGAIPMIAIKEFGELLKSKIGFNHDFDTLNDLVMFNRYRGASKEEYEFLASNMALFPLESRRTFCSDVFLVTSGFTKASRPVKKILNTDPILIYTYKMLADVIKQPDNQLKVYNIMISEAFKERDLHNEFLRTKFSALKALINIFKDETIAVNKLTIGFKKYSSEVFRYIFDMEYQHERLVENNIQCSTKGDIKEVHDRISMTNNLIGRTAKPIPLSKEDKERELCVGGASFVAAEDTAYLVHIGQAMNICVGGYDRQVLNGRCRIYYVMFANKLEACIEVRGRIIHQVKSYNNDPVNRFLQSRVSQWAYINNLIFDTYDLEEIGTQPVDYNFPTSTNLVRLTKKDIEYVLEIMEQTQGQEEALAF